MQEYLMLRTLEVKEEEKGHIGEVQDHVQTP